MSRKERRRMPRTHSNVYLDLYDSKGQAIIGEGRFVNVSMNGSQLESRQPLQLHQHIRLQVQTPGTSAFEFAGEIIWRKKKASLFNYGVRFEPISAAHVFNRQPAAAYAHLHR